MDKYVDSIVYKPREQKISETEQEVFDFIKNYIEKHDYSPSTRDIIKNCSMRSLSTVYRYMQKLKAKGLIDWEPSIPRTIRIVNRGYVKRPS